MKKFLSILFIFTLSIVVIIPVGASAQSINNYTIDTPYEFPITPDDPEWKTFTEKQQMVAECQIPERILESMTTSALIQTVLDYPLINDIHLFNSPEDASRVLSQDFNGFRELYTRKDTAKKLLDAYQSSSVMDSVDTHSTSRDFFTPRNLEFLIAAGQTYYDVLLTESEQLRFTELLNEKNIARYDAGIYSQNSCAINAFIETANNQPSTRAGENIVNEAYVKTPNGSSVFVNQFSPDLTSAGKQAYKEETARSYPLAKYVSEATIKYNCHSYETRDFQLLQSGSRSIRPLEWNRPGNNPAFLFCFIS